MLIFCGILTAIIATPLAILFFPLSVVWLISAIICAVMAESRNRSRGGWFLGGVWFGPFAIAALALAGKAPLPLTQQVAG